MSQLTPQQIHNTLPYWLGSNKSKILLEWPKRLQKIFWRILKITYFSEISTDWIDELTDNFVFSQVQLWRRGIGFCN